MTEIQCIHMNSVEIERPNCWTLMAF